MTVDEVAGLLSTHAYLYCDEDELQQGIAQVLGDAGVAFDREWRAAAAGRIDFRVGGVGVEVKVDGSLPAVLRQLHRYACCSEFPDGLVLVTSRRRHAGGAPAEIGGKPFRVVIAESLL